MKLKRKYLILIVLTACVIVFDQITKFMIVDRFRYGESIPVISGFFNLTYIRNTGAAFGILAHANPAFRIPFFVIVPIIALIAIAFIFRKIPDRDVKLSAALSLVIGGAVGNLIDRVMLSYVVDFLDFHWRYEYHFPAFNVADTAICIGVGILMLDLLSQPDDAAKETSLDASASH
ncbi:signal peptidase II [Bdellovibrionota bacterium FG-1]